MQPKDQRDFGPTIFQRPIIYRRQGFLSCWDFFYKIQGPLRQGVLAFEAKMQILGTVPLPVSLLAIRLSSNVLQKMRGVDFSNGKAAWPPTQIIYVSYPLSCA